jgi:hypothetical protein
MKAPQAWLDAAAKYPQWHPQDLSGIVMYWNMYHVDPDQIVSAPWQFQGVYIQQPDASYVPPFTVPEGQYLDLDSLTVKAYFSEPGNKYDPTQHFFPPL